jgi:hypothetical protein
MTKFLVNGQVKEIKMHFNGIECSADFIGNTHHGMGLDDEGRYVASQEDYEWWVKVISDHEAMEDTIARYKEAHDDPDEVDRMVQSWIGVDLEDQPAQVRLGLEMSFS